MSVELVSLSDIFSKDRFFRIPDFQRGYSWGDDEVNDFWLDLTELHDDKYHYTGQITIESISDERNFEYSDIWLKNNGKRSPLYIIDGQQRITTCVILIVALLETWNDISATEKKSIFDKFLYISRNDREEKKYCIFGYEKDNPSDEYWKSKILKVPSLSNNDIETIWHTREVCGSAYFPRRLVQS